MGADLGSYCSLGPLAPSTMGPLLCPRVDAPQLVSDGYMPQSMRTRVPGLRSFLASRLDGVIDLTQAHVTFHLREWLVQWPQDMAGRRVRVALLMECVIFVRIPEGGGCEVVASGR